jgi:hypothetical protein
MLLPLYQSKQVDRRGAKKRILLPVPHMGGREQEYFHQGICLPSSSSLPLEDQLYVVNQVRAVAGVGPLSELQKELITVI